MMYSYPMSALSILHDTVGRNQWSSNILRVACADIGANIEQFDSFTARLGSGDRIILFSEICFK